MCPVRIPVFEGSEAPGLVKISLGKKESFKELLCDVAITRAHRDLLFEKQGIHVDLSVSPFNATSVGLEVASYLVKRFEKWGRFTSVDQWQMLVRNYERWSSNSLRLERQDLLTDIRDLEVLKIMQEVNRALAHLQAFYPVPKSAISTVEGELSGMANPDLTVSIMRPDGNGQCPQGYYWSGRAGACVPVQDNVASTAFDITKGANLASSTLRRPRGEVPSRTQMSPEGTKIALDAGNSARWTAGSSNDSRPNRAMGYPDSCQQSDLGIETQEMPGGDRLQDVPPSDQPAYGANATIPRQGIKRFKEGERGPDGCLKGMHWSVSQGKCVEGLSEGELSGMSQPDTTIRVVQPDGNGQCPPGTIWSGRVGGCVAISDSTASTGFDITPGANRADSPLRKARSLTDRTKFTPEGTKVPLDAGGRDRLHPDNYGTPNRAMGDAGIEVSDVGIRTQEMPGGNRLPDRPHPDQPAYGVDAATARKVHSEALRIVEGVPERILNDVENSGFKGPLALLSDLGRKSLERHWVDCMRMLSRAHDHKTDKPYSYYASKNATDQYCFFLHEGVYDGYVDHLGTMRHVTTMDLHSEDAALLEGWRLGEEAETEKKERLREEYERDRKERAKHQLALETMINRGWSDDKIRNCLIKEKYPRQLIRGLMRDVGVLRMTVFLHPKPKSPRAKINIHT
jgi:hypothetical protein